MLLSWITRIFNQALWLYHLNVPSCLAPQTSPFRFSTHRLVLAHVYFQNYTVDYMLLCLAQLTVATKLLSAIAVTPKLIFFLILTFLLHWPPLPLFLSQKEILKISTSQSLAKLCSEIHPEPWFVVRGLCSASPSSSSFTQTLKERQLHPYYCRLHQQVPVISTYQLSTVIYCIEQL